MVLVCHFDLIHAGAFEVFPVDALYDFCLLRINDQMPVVILCVSEEAIVVVTRDWM